jgi:diacylglycerol kinase
MEPVKKEGFHPRHRLKSMSNAVRGLKIMFGSQYNIWIQTVFLAVVVLAGIFFGITVFEWILIIFASGLVFVAEAINTAIEIDINLTSPEYHPYARDTKDVAAGAVLIASMVAFAIGVVIFLPRIMVICLQK